MTALAGIGFKWSKGKCASVMKEIDSDGDVSMQELLSATSSHLTNN